MKEKIVSAAYIAYGLIDVAASIMSGFVLFHMVGLGAVCLAAGVGLWMKKPWSRYPLGFAGLLTLVVGVATLYSSMGLVGFNPNVQVLLFNLSLIGYIGVMSGLIVYVIANKSVLFR